MQRAFGVLNSLRYLQTIIRTHCHNVGDTTYFGWKLIFAFLLLFVSYNMDSFWKKTQTTLLSAADRLGNLDVQNADYRLTLSSIRDGEFFLNWNTKLIQVHLF